MRRSLNTLSAPRRLRYESLERRRMLSMTPQLVSDLEIGVTGRGHLTTAVVDDELYFVNSSSTSANSLGLETHGIWKTDGTPEGTMQLASFPNSYGCSRPWIVNVDGTPYFDIEGQWWKSDGTPEGTVKVPERPPEPFSPYGHRLGADEVEMDGTTYYVSDDELWKTDGTVEGTAQVRDVTSADGASPKYLTNVHGTLFFNAEDGEGGSQLWKSDGTAEGTVKMTDFDVARSQWRHGPRNIVAMGRTVFFSSRNGDAGIQLWKLEPPAGDTNYDGVVDFNDFLRLAETMGETGKNLAADFNQDGVVGLTDLEILRGNFGFGVEPSSPVPRNTDRDGPLDSPDPVFLPGESEHQIPDDRMGAVGGSYLALEVGAAELEIETQHDIDESIGVPAHHSPSSKPMTLRPAVVDQAFI